MEELNLVRVDTADPVFLQYLPGNFRHLPGRDEAVCVGAVYQGMACGAALAEETAPGVYYLRYLFIDPRARLCGLGTYLLRGLLGELDGRGAFEVKAVYTPGMLEEGRQTLGVLERAGFTAPKPISTAFSVRLGDIRIPEAELPQGAEVYTADEMPDALIDAYEALLLRNALPAFVDPGELGSPQADLTSVCAVDGQLAGILLVDRQEQALCVAGLYVMEAHRKGFVTPALIANSIGSALALYPPETEVIVSAINRQSFALCDRLFRRNSTTHKETELLSVYRF